MRKLLMIVWLVGFSILLASCEVPAPGTPLPTVTPLPAATPTLTALLPSPTAAQLPTTTPPPAARPIAEKSPAPGKLWPSRPADFASYAEEIVNLMNAAPVNIVRLRPMLRDWGAIGDRLGEVREADMDGDGQMEWIVAIADPTPLTLTVAGNLLVIDKQGDTYRLIYQILPQADSYRDNVVILATKDINADGKAELAYTTTTCGAHTCFTAVHLYAWDGANFRSLTQDQIQMPYGEASLENREGDAALELVLHGGTIGSVGAGPQRARTELCAWNGKYYVPTKTTYDESDFLYFRVLDANVAMKAGDYKRAIALYQDVITSSKLRVWKEWIDEGKQERSDLVALSRFRLMLTYVLAKDDAKANEMLEGLQRDQPEHIYTQVAQAFWQAYGEKKDIAAACLAVTEFAYQHPETVDVLADFGYANPSFTPEEVCPIGIGKP